MNSLDNDDNGQQKHDLFQSENLKIILQLNQCQRPNCSSSTSSRLPFSSTSRITVIIISIINTTTVLLHCTFLNFCFKGQFFQSYTRLGCSANQTFGNCAVAAGLSRSSYASPPGAGASQND